MDLSLQLQQKQILSQRMQQSVEILQMNTLALSEYIREVSEENPLLDWSENHVAEKEVPSLLQKLEWLQEGDEQNRGYYQMDMDNEKEREDWLFGKKEAQNLREYLLFQIHILPIEEQEKKILCFLAESIEESGYLETDALQAAKKRYGLTTMQAEQALQRLQSLDPLGVGARDLKECLQIQLKQKNTSVIVLQIVEQYLHDIAKNRIAYVAKKLHLSMEQMYHALEEIRNCSPKPGSGFGTDRPVEYVIPDVFVERKGEELFVSVNQSAVPHLFVTPFYQKLLQEDQSKETKEYIMHKLKQAQWAVQCINRRETTLLQTTKQIVLAQREFFLYPNGTLKPLRMVDIAERIQMHVSTVSRAVKEKYLQCEKGIFALTDFFSKAMTTDGIESVSAQSIQNRIEAMIAQEDKTRPYSDRELTEQLTAAGIHISRRTVAKYREAMGIPGALGRKRY